MPVCPNCGATVPDGAIACGRCGAPLNQPQTSSISQSPATSGTTTTSWGSGPSSELQARFQKALKRNEMLSYVLVGLSIVLIVIVLI